MFTDSNKKNPTKRKLTSGKVNALKKYTIKNNFNQKWTDDVFTF